MKTENAKLVTFGRGGDTVYINRNCSVTGYGSPEHPHAAEPTPGRLFPDGTPVVDTRATTETDTGFLWAIKGPLVNVDLPDNNVESCPEPSPLMAVAMSCNEFGALLGLQHAHRETTPTEPGPLDMVSISAFVAGWKRHGARIGHYHNGHIVWDD